MTNNINTNNEKNKMKCFWEVTGVDAEGNIIVKVYNMEKQKELNELTEEAQRKHKEEKQRIEDADNKYCELLDLLGIEASIEVFSAAGKAYVRNMKKQLAEDEKVEQRKQALLEGAAAARAGSSMKATKTTTKTTAQRVETLVVTEQGVW